MRPSSCTVSPPGRRPSCSTASAPRCSSRSRSIRPTPTASSTASASWCSTCRARTGRSCTTGSPSTGCDRLACWPPARPARVWRSTAPTTASIRSRRTWATTWSPSSSRRTPSGDLWKGAAEIETNKAAPNYARVLQFDAAKDLASLSAIVDIQDSLTSWAAEALLNDSDGYYGGSHNFYLYDQGTAGYVFLSADLDSTLDWLVTFDTAGATDHPIYWWSTRAMPTPIPGDKWMIVFADAGWRAKYADAIAGLLAKWDVGRDPGLDRQLVAADLRRRQDRSAHLGDPGQHSAGHRDGPRRDRQPRRLPADDSSIVSAACRARRPTRTGTAIAGATSATTRTPPCIRGRWRSAATESTTTATARLTRRCGARTRHGRRHGAGGGARWEERMKGTR